ncbi:MAG: hypothetical protein Q4A05_10695 [Ruminococcus sp.]|nr:hypothetical protein [Ruminococcus sp.]
MKKFIAVSAAAVLLGTMCACADKSDTSEPVGGVTAPAVSDIPTGAEAPTEPPFLELTEEDFTPVDMKCDITDSAPPVDISPVDLSGLDLGERLSPCMSTAGGGEPCEGRIEPVVFLGGRFFFGVNYDEWDGHHDSALYRYDPETGELKELTDGRGYFGCFDCLSAIKGRLVFFADSEEGSTSTLYEVDPESGEITELCTVDHHIDYIFGNEQGVLITAAHGDGTIREVYDFDKGGLVEPSDVEGLYTGGRDTVYYCDGVPAEVTGGLVDGQYTPLTIKTQYYELSTEHLTFDQVVLWKDKVCVNVTDVLGKGWLYTYDLKRNERLKMRFGGSNLAKTGDALVESQTTNGSYGNYTSIFYTVPHYGTVFRMKQEDSDVLLQCSCGGKTCVITFTSVADKNGRGFSYHYINSDGSTSYLGAHQLKPAKLFVFEE